MKIINKINIKDLSKYNYIITIIFLTILLLIVLLNKSDEEILSSRIAEYKVAIEDKEKTIEALRSEINTIDKPYYECYRIQLLRLADWLEYNIDYCDKNLKTFEWNEKGLK